MPNPWDSDKPVAAPQPAQNPWDNDVALGVEGKDYTQLPLGVMHRATDNRYWLPSTQQWHAKLPDGGLELAHGKANDAGELAVAQEYSANQPASGPSVESVSQFAPSHAKAPSKERAMAAEQERLASDQGGYGWAGRTAENVALSTLKGGTNLLEIPGALAKAQAGIVRGVARKIGGEKAAQAVAKIQPYLPAAAGGTLGVDPVQKRIESASRALSAAMPSAASPIVRDPQTGAEFFNWNAAKDPQFWINIVGEEAAPMAAQIVLAKLTGGSSAALNPALLAKLEKAGKVGKFAIKALTSQGVRAMAGFEAARTLPSVQKEATEKYVKMGLDPVEAEERAATWGTISSALQGAVGGVMDFKILEDALTRKATGLLPKLGGYVATALKEGGEEAAQSITQSAIEKMSYNPTLTLDSALRQAGAEFLGGVGMGVAMRGATRGARNIETEAEPLPAPAEVAPEAVPEKQEGFIKLANEMGAADTVRALQGEGENLSRIELDPEQRYGKIDLDVPEIASDVLSAPEPIGPEPGVKPPTGRDVRRAEVEQGATEQAESVDAMQAERETLVQQVAEAEDALKSARRRRGPKGSATAQANLDNAREALAAVEERIAKNTGKWENTKAAWADLKAELQKEGGERGAIGAQTNPEVFAKTAALVKAAIADGYQNVTDWLADMRDKMDPEDFKALYASIGGVDGAHQIWDEHSVTRGEEGGLTPQGSGTGLLSNEELKRQQRGDTYYRVDRSGRVTNLGPQPDATVRTGEAVVMVDGLTGKPQVQNSQGLGNDSAVLAKFGNRVSQVHEQGRGMIADNLGLQQLYEAGMNKAKAQLGLDPIASDGDVVRAVQQRIGKLGATVKETVVRIMAKVKGIGRDLAEAIAKHLHEAVSGSRVAQKGAVGKDVNGLKRIEIGEYIPGDDKKVARSEAYSQIGQVIKTASRQEQPDIIGLMKMVPSEVQGVPAAVTREFRREFARGAKYFMSPSTMSMRDRALQMVNKSINRFVATKENILFAFGDTTAQFDALDAGQRESLSAALMYGTLANDGKGKIWTEAELAKNFPNLTPAAISVYKNITSHIKDTTARLIEAEKKVYEQQVKKAEAIAAEGDDRQKKRIKEGMKELAEAFKARIEALSNNAYFPLMRFGDYRLTIKDKDGKRIGMAFITDPTDSAEIQAAINRMKAQDPTVRKAVDAGEFTQDPIQKNPERDYSGPGIPEPSLMRYMLATKDIDPRLFSEIELAAFNAYLGDTWKAHLTHRTGLPGFDMDGLKVYKHYAHMLANRIANLQHGEEMDSAQESMSDKARGKDYDPGLETEARDLLDSVRNPPYIPVANVLNSLAFISDLGFKASLVVQNLTQQGTMGLPVLGNFYGQSNATGAFIAGNRIASSFIRPTNLGGIEGLTVGDLVKTINKTIKPELFTAYRDPKGMANLVKVVLKDSARDGELRPKASLELMAKRDTTGMSAVEEGLSQVAEVAGYFVSKSEQQNRIATLVASVVLAYEHGIISMDQNGWKKVPVTLESVNDDGTVNLLTADQKNQVVVDTREFAEFMNRIINFSSGPGNMSWYQRQRGFGGGVLRIATQYKRFMIDSLTALHNLGILNARNNPQALAKAYGYAKPWLINAAMTMFVGGSSAIPMWLILKFIMKHVLGEWYEDWITAARERLANNASTAAQMSGMTKEQADKLGKKMAFSAENGISNMLPEGYGINLNGALMPSLIMGPDNSTVFEDMGRLAGGSFGGKIMTMGESINQFGAKNPEAYTEGLAKVFSGAPKGLQQAVTGEYRVGNETLPLTPFERAARGLSFQPTEPSRLQATRSQGFEGWRAKQELVAVLKKRYNNAKNKEDVLDDIMSRVDKFNETYAEKDPRMIINVKRDIMGSARHPELERLYEKSGVTPR